MRVILILFSFCIAANLSGQVQDVSPEMQKFIEDNNIRFNKVDPPEGFTLYYNCDSMIFMRADSGDTIRILTPAASSAQDLETFKETMRSENYGKTLFAESLYYGKFWVSSYHQTTFLFRSDSLFEFANTTKYPMDFMMKVMEKVMAGEITMDEFIMISDSVNMVFNEQSVYAPKLIFSPAMFNASIDRVTPPLSLNFMGDTIILEKQWTQNGHPCYFFTINNQLDDGTKTSYGYSINNELKFVQWQGCSDR